MPIVTAVVVPLVCKTNCPLVSALETKAVPLVVPADIELIYIPPTIALISSAVKPKAVNLTNADAFTASLDC